MLMLFYIRSLLIWQLVCLSSSRFHRSEPFSSRQQSWRVFNGLFDKNETVASLSPFREANQKRLHPILHASISCKWTIRSDRSQNTRTEALNLIRNRKGNLPHIVAVTAEPLPTRIAALALGTGDLDCVYHFALPELLQAIKTIDNEDQLDILTSMVDGRRLRDISDLPFDLAV
jgi:hypothetical protein